MTRTVLIEGLIDTLKGIATKIINNPTNSHLTSNVTSETNSVLLTGAAKNTALKELIIDFEPYQRDTPSTEEPATIFATEFYNVFVSENAITDEEPEGEFHAYAINLGRVVYGGRIDIKNKKVLVTWEYIEEYDGETLPGEWLSTMDVYAEGTTPTTGAGVAYKIAEPYYIDIDGATIKTIASANDCYVTGDSYFTKAIEVDYVRDEALAIENLEQQGGGGFAPTLLGTFTSVSQPAGTDLEILDCSDYGWLIVEFEKPNESMAGYNGPFRKTIWIPTDSMTEGSTQEVGVAYNEVSATSMAVTAILPMVSIKDSTHVHIIAGGNFVVSRVWGV